MSMDLGLNELLLEEIIRRALLEDIGTGDLTSNTVIDSQVNASGNFLVKETGVIAGLEVVKEVFRQLDSKVMVNTLYTDGAKVPAQTVAATVIGPARAIMTGERTALNIMQRLSGIATQTARYAAIIKDEKAVVVDTRKTTPGLRMLEKYAVRVGGGRNHRYGLYDAVMIKDNHIVAAGGITAAVEKAKAALGHAHKIEVETENLAMVAEALAAGADIIMLDNMNTAAMQEAVKLINGRAIVEASGGINEQTILAVAQTGVDIISVGALTHSVRALDISLDITEIY